MTSFLAPTVENNERQKLDLDVSTLNNIMAGRREIITRVTELLRKGHLTVTSRYFIDLLIERKNPPGLVGEITASVIPPPKIFNA